MKSLVKFLDFIPGAHVVADGVYDTGCWWVKLRLDIDDPLSWCVVQELGHVLNLLSMERRLPTRFYPVSPSPALNGGPEDFLSWFIEATDANFAPSMAATWLAGRLPRPGDDRAAWGE